MAVATGRYRWLLLGLLVRCCLVYLGYSSVLSERIEVSSPLWSLKRLKEGVALGKIKLSPYTGSAFHAPPLLISTLGKLAFGGEHLIFVPFIVADLMAAAVLGMIGVELGVASDLSHVASIYLLNPLTILSCIGGSLGVFENLFIALAIYGAISSKPALSAFGICCAGYLAVHPFLLMVPICILIHGGPEHHRTIRSSVAVGEFTPTKNSRGRVGVMLFLLFGGLWATTLFGLSDLSLHQFPEHACQSWVPWVKGHVECHSGSKDGFPSRAEANHWIYEAYGVLLNVTDLSPNIGLFWYFFTEIFPGFRSFFTFVFHAVSALFLIPLAIRFPDRPLLVVLIQCASTALLKPYPTIADTALYLGLIPLFPSIVETLQWWWWLLISFLILAVQTPLVWQEWIHVGSANSNFFYAVTMLSALWHVSLIVMLLHGAVAPRGKGMNIEPRAKVEGGKKKPKR